MELTGRFHTYFCGVSSLCHIGGACASIKEMVLTRTGVVIKIIDDDTFGDYTSEFQSVLRACEEHLDKFTCSFLPYGLLIKFANEGKRRVMTQKHTLPTTLWWQRFTTILMRLLSHLMWPFFLEHPLQLTPTYIWLVLGGAFQLVHG